MTCSHAGRRSGWRQRARCLSSSDYRDHHASRSLWGARWSHASGNGMVPWDWQATVATTTKDVFGDQSPQPPTSDQEMRDLLLTDSVERRTDRGVP